MSSIVQVPIVGRFLYRDDPSVPATGARISFNALTTAVVDGSDVTLPKKLACVLNANGELPAGFSLPTVGDGVYYRITERFPGGRDPYDILVTPTDTSIDLATVAPVVTPPELVSIEQAAVIQAAYTARDAAQASAVAADASKTAAGSSAATAVSAASSAAGDAAAAAASAISASNSAVTASAAKDTATSAAATATTKASEASASATAAAGSTSAAAASAGAASASANAAAGSASDAAATKDAVDAKFATLATVATSGLYADLSSKPTLGDAAAKNVGTTAGTVAAGNDARLSDARTPTAHTHTAAQISDSTAVGRSVVTATDAAAARSAIGALATTGGTMTGAVTATAASGPAFISKNAEDDTTKSFGLGVGGSEGYKGHGKLVWGDGSMAMRFVPAPYYAAEVTGALSATGGLAMSVPGQGIAPALIWESSGSRSGTTLVGYYAYAEFPGTNNTKIWFGGTMTGSKLSFAIGNYTKREVASLNEAGHFLTTGPITAQKAVVASLPTGSDGMTAYATNGRKQGEGSGAGTGVPVYFSAAKWRRYSDDTEVVA